MFNKQEIRVRMLALREQLAESCRIEAAQKFAEQFSQTPLFQRSQHIGFYLPVGGELDPQLLCAQAPEEQWYLPVLSTVPQLDSTHKMEFFAYQPGNVLYKNQYGILEPDPNVNELWPAEKLDLVLVPVVAVDDDYNRLGMGKGYYDQRFAFLLNSRQQSINLQPYLLGIAYNFQKQHALPVDPWDVRVDEVWIVDIVSEVSYK